MSTPRVPREYPVSTPCRPAERAAHLSTVAEMLDDPDENVRWEVPREYSASTPGVLCEHPVSTLRVPREYSVSTP